MSDSCVAEGARVLTSRGLRPIESLIVDDVILSVDPASGEAVASPITRIVSTKRECVLLRAGDVSSGGLTVTNDPSVTRTAHGGNRGDERWRRVEQHRCGGFLGDRRLERVQLEFVDFWMTSLRRGRGGRRFESGCRCGLAPSLRGLGPRGRDPALPGSVEACSGGRCWEQWPGFSPVIRSRRLERTEQSTPRDRPEASTRRVRRHQ